MKKNWLKNHIVELLALISVIQAIIINMLVLFHVVKSTDSATLMIVSNSTSMAFLSLNFFLGSSKSSKDKQIELDKQQEEINKKI